jgi:hypothetical protein
MGVAKHSYHVSEELGIRLPLDFFSLWKRTAYLRGGSLNCAASGLNFRPAGVAASPASLVSFKARGILRPMSRIAITTFIERNHAARVCQRHRRGEK